MSQRISHRTGNLNEELVLVLAPDALSVLTMGEGEGCEKQCRQPAEAECLLLMCQI